MLQYTAYVGSGGVVALCCFFCLGTHQWYLPAGMDMPVKAEQGAVGRRFVVSAARRWLLSTTSVNAMRMRVALRCSCCCRSHMASARLQWCHLGVHFEQFVMCDTHSQIKVVTLRRYALLAAVDWIQGVTSIWMGSMLLAASRVHTPFGITLQQQPAPSCEVGMTA
jgi:hypothetical protein